MEPKLDFWNILVNRRSSRKFKPGPVPAEQVEKLLAAAVQAPNAHNRQSWRFVVLQQPADIEQLADGMSIDYRQTLLDGGMPAEEVAARAEGRKARICAAPLVVVLCVDTDDLDGYDDENRNSGEYLMAVQSAALGGGHLLLAAEALGLGGLWMCAPLFAPARVQEALGLPESWLAQGMLLLGESDDDREKRPRKPLADVVKYV